MRKSTEKRGEKSAVFSMLCFCQKAGNTRFVLSCSKGYVKINITKAKPKGTNHGSYV